MHRVIYALLSRYKLRKLKQTGQYPIAVIIISVRVAHTDACTDVQTNLSKNFSILHVNAPLFVTSIYLRAL